MPWTLSNKNNTGLTYTNNLTGESCSLSKICGNIMVKAIYGHPNYLITSDGKVLSYKNNKHGLRKEPIEMKLQFQNNGYSSIRIDKKTYFVHRLLAEHFIINPDNKLQVNHINGIKTDNRIENLEWCTSSENIKHAFNTGLNKITQKQKEDAAKRSIKRGKQIIDNITGKVYESLSIAAKENNINKFTLQDYLTGRRQNKTNLTYNI